MHQAHVVSRSHIPKQKQKPKPSRRHKPLKVISCETDNPERRLNEKFIGNVTLEEYEANSSPTKRIGKTSYSPTGDPIISEPQVYPLFISSGEEYTQILNTQPDI